MFGLSLPDYGALVRQFLLLISTICGHVAMFLSRSASFQWIRRRFSKRAPPHAANNSTSTRAAPEAEECVAAPQLSARNKEGDLAEVLVLNDTKIEAAPAAASVDALAALGGGCSGSGGLMSGGRCKAAAPIARVESEDDCECSSGEVDAAVRRSKSRVRTYLKKCRDRLTGQHHHAAVAVCGGDIENQLKTPERPMHEQECDCTLEAAEVGVADAVLKEDTVGSYEDIDFALSTALLAASACHDIAAMECSDVEAQPTYQLCASLAGSEERLAVALQTESAGIAALIDSHLAHIFPRYADCTRAILIRQARDLLVCSYQGCLQSFEQQFLSKYATIASALKRQHSAGESLIWRTGWPLATPSGELILHLGCLDEALLRPAEIYLCVRTADRASVPQLHVVWRAAHSEAAVQSRRVELSDEPTQPTPHLSALTLEMLSGDELPQLLQNLLVGVERAITRISLNELQMPAVSQQQQLLAADVTNNNSGHIESNATRPGNNSAPNCITSSPKCALKRSELITKSKTLSSKYMLRRLTNRQDSMNSTSSGNSCASSGSASSDELLYCHNNNNSHAGTLPQQPASTSPALPLFCLGNSFPHIDSDEENPDEKRNSLDADQFESEIVPPRSITEIPEKLLTSGIELPGTRDLKGQPIVTVDAASVAAAGLNCYEIATVLLYYSTVPESESLDSMNGNGAPQPVELQSHSQQQQPRTTTPAQSKSAQQAFTILIAIEQSAQLCVVDLICQSLKLLRRHVAHCEILAVCLERNLLELCKSNARPCADTGAAAGKQPQPQPQQQPLQQQEQQHLVKFISVSEVTTSVAASSQLPRGKLQGCHHHDARKWREFFAQLEPFQRLCAVAGQRLVTAMSDIRSADLQGLPTRRQLYAQHRALSRALMDSELHSLRKRGKSTLLRLQELARDVSSAQQHAQNSAHKLLLAATTAAASGNYSTFTVNSHHRSQHSSSKLSAMTSDNSNNNTASTESSGNIDVTIRLRKVALLFNEVDRAAKRLEQLTEQRRERLRELTRQRALEDEMTEVTSWITSDGSETLQRFVNVQLDCETAVKESEQQFEKYYFISMKHLAKGRDLHAAAANMEALRESAVNLKAALDCFEEKLEQARERIEGASRLHHLMSLHVRDESAQQEMQRLAEQLGVSALLEKYEQQQQEEQSSQQPTQQCVSENVQKVKPNSLNLGCSRAASKPYGTPLFSSTPVQKAQRLSHRSSSGNGSFEAPSQCHCWRESRNLEDMDEFLDGDEEEDGEEEQSKIADSGLGGCERCEGNPKLTRVCSCQSLNEAANMYDKSDELDDECFERPSKPYMSIHSPIEANAHLQCHASSLDLPMLEELSCLDPKIQKTLLLIMREMIGTERDYVRSLYYVIENYVDELLRDDIPQPLRGQRNVIFGNIEKIFEFHNSHFLSELERYERNPLKVGAAFLEMESKFYLYALYNKNKPKSDTLMSEYGTAFFKSKQFELTDRMDLASYLLKPVQRMGKYALLLQQLVKACNPVEGAALQEIGADVEELQRAEEMVKFQLRHGNDLLAMDSLRDCDVNVKEQGRLLRQNEFLVWQGRGGKKTLRQIFLFEELVLFSKARRFPDHKNLDIYLYKNSIKTSDIGLTAHVGDSPTKFEIWFRKRKPDDTWTMQCMSEDIKNAWTEEISKLLWKQAKRNREIRLAEMSSMGIGSKPCLDIRPSNNQISDRSITISQLGKAPKLRHSFVGLHAESAKASRRPNSLISESSLSSGTSSSSLSTGSSSGHERAGKNTTNNHGLELINETQALMLSSQGKGHNSSANTNTLSSGCSSGISGNMRNHKRSTTLVSQLSMESGILSDISMTPDQEQVDVAAWSASAAATTPTSAAAGMQAIFSNSTTTAVVMRRHRTHKHEPQKELRTDVLSESSNPYLKDKEETINL